ncbi:MAG TPA: NADH-ubiquinone oxidoreductase-F iron-sulfur binding region domain-containing protein, partial [Syntrophales bacterium]|nr:NADH-ubiquinone oxidoreductase-F iron-sulfur binding region domain-containing protein [Syntrophales bacterium]
MNTVSFSSWNGKIVDNRNGQVPASKLAEVNFPEKLDGQEPAAVMGWDGIVVRDAQADLLSLTLAYLKEARKLSCGECSVCMIGIDKVIGIMKAMMEGQGSAENVEEIEEIARGVAANSKCNYGRTTALTPVLDAVRYFRDDFLALANGEKKVSEKAYSSAVTAPCMEACPAKLDIPGYIELIRNNRFGDSLNLIRKRCILPGVLGRACTHPCESACVRNDIDETLAIRLLKRAAADYDLGRDGSALGKPAAEREERVAIVGAGPAGLAAAYHLRLMGYQVTVFEALPVAGGMAMVGIPAYRLPRNVLNHEVELIEKMGVDIRLNSKVTQLDWDGLQQQGYKA